MAHGYRQEKGEEADLKVLIMMDKRLNCNQAKNGKFRKVLYSYGRSGCGEVSRLALNLVLKLLSKSMKPNAVKTEHCKHLEFCTTETDTV